MKLFFKEHIGLIIIQFIQITLFSLIIYLSGFTDLKIFLYGALLSLFLLVSYLVIHYFTRKSTYKKLTKQPTNLHELLESTDDKPLGRALEQLTKANYQLFMKQLKQAEENQENHLIFINRWVHQMKTPLSVIELTAKELDEPESANLREETEKLKNGLNTVLYMARMQRIEEDFHIQPVDLNKLIKEINHENKRLFIRNNIYPYVTNDSASLVESDEKWLYFILEQLIQNAIKYSVNKSNRIDIYMYEQTGRAALEITDYGAGIPEHDINRIYEAFYTGDHGRAYRESTGMGLYLVKEVIDYLGHTIDVTSTLNEGTTFKLTFTKTQTLK